MEEENALAVVVADMTYGRFWSRFIHYNLYVTNKRLVFGKIGSGPAPYYMRNTAARVIYAVFFGFPGSLVGLFRLTVQRTDTHQYDRMDFEQIVKADKHNFALSFDKDLQCIELKEKQMAIPAAGKISAIIIQFVPGVKRPMSLPGKATIEFSRSNFPEVKSALQAVTLGKLVVK